MELRPLEDQTMLNRREFTRYGAALGLSLPVAEMIAPRRIG